MIVAIADAKSSGATTTTLALAAVWPDRRPVFVAEVDPAGGDLAPRFGLPPEPSILELGSLVRRGLEADDVARHLQTLPGGLRVLVGPNGPEQAEALSTTWPMLASVLGGSGTDVLADCGRLGPGSPALHVADHAALLLLVARPTLEGVAHLERLLRAAPARTRIGVVLVGERPYSAAEVGRTLGVDVLGTLADDPKAASLLAGRPGSRPALGRSRLLRSAGDVARAVVARIAATRPVTAGVE